MRSVFENMHMDIAIAVTLKVALTLLFSTALLHKVLRRAEFTRTVGSYLRGFGLQGSVPVAVAALLSLCGDAGVIASCLLADASAGGLAAAAMLWLYAVAMQVNLLRGNALLDCGCSWGSQRQPVRQALVVRNVLLGALALLLILPSDQRTLSAVDWANILLATLTAAALYAAANHLFTLGNRSTAS